MTQKINSLDVLKRPELEQALQYLLKTNFYAFCVFYDPLFFTEAKTYLFTLCNALQKVSDGIIKKLAISLPPRAGKSYTVSLWCAWMIGRGLSDPATSIMRNSYGQTLAEKFSGDVKQILKSEKFQFVFSVKMKDGHDRAEDWAIEGSAQSTYFCSGVSGAITGRGCKTAAILDDPIKNLEDALSEVILDKTWNWYTSTHKSRMESGCPEIHIATRWSKKDPIGMVTALEVDEWFLVVIPALTEDGKSFCEAVKTTKEYLELKKILDDFIWEAEFMQNPIESKGLLYPINELNRFSMSELDKYYKGDNKLFFDVLLGYTDIADEGADYLCSVAAAIVGEKVYLIDAIYTQDPIEVTQPLVAAMIIKTEQHLHRLESNNGGKSFGIKIKELVLEELSCNIKWKQTTKNKETRILMKAGLVKEFFYFRNDYEIGSEYDKFIKALTSYVRLGKNKHDDAPDAVTGLAEMIYKNRKLL